MSPTSIDHRAVEMGFDNRQFEQGVGTTIKSLDKLKEGLNLDKSAKSLTNLSNASRNFSMGNIADSVQSISSKFSALGVIGFTVLQNLTNAAINFGRQLVNQIFTPMRTGFQEYETQINAIQTVLANTQKEGTTLTQVNDALDQLNTYADKTIYNFTEMTRNIGTFTAAGVKLDTSVAAIKGIANLAAVSGSNSQQASTAMYQLSQALASGTVKLMDWNSVVNAGMGGQVFQDALKETARVHGIAIDDMIKNEGSFRETLQNGWLTSEVLLETLEKFTGDLTEEQLVSMGYTQSQIKGILELGQTANDAATKVKTFTQLQETVQEAIQSGWGQTWRLLIGDFDQAKALFTEISDTLGPMIDASSKARNEFLADWIELGGRKYIIDSVRNAFEGFLTIIKPIQEAFREIFPPATAAQFAQLALDIREFTAKLSISAETADKIKRIFKGLFAILDIGRMFVQTLAERFLELFQNVAPSTESILDFLAGLGDYVLGIRDAIKANDSFNVAIDNIINFVVTAKDRIIDFANTVRTRFEEVRSWFKNVFSKINIGPVGDVFSSIFERISERLSPLKEALENINFTLEPLQALGKIVGGVIRFLGRIFKAGLPGFFKFASGVGEFLRNLGSTIAEGLSNINFSDLFDKINSGLFAAILLAIRQFITKGGGAMDELGGAFGNLGGIFEGVTGILDGVRGSLEAWQQNLKAKTLLTIAGAIAILAGSLLVLSLIDSEKLTIAIGAVTAMFAELVTSMAVFDKIGGSGGGLKVGAALIALSTSILIISGALTILSKIDPVDMQNALLAMGAIIVAMVGFSKSVSTNSGGILKSAVGMLVFSIALRSLVGVVEALGDLDPLQLTNGLIGVGVLLAEIGAFLKLTDGAGGGIGQGLGLLGVAAALTIISDVVEKLGDMDVLALQQGLIAMGAVLGELALFIKLNGDSKQIITTAIGLTILGGAMEIFADVLVKLGQLSLDEIGRGLLAMGGALVIIAGAMRLMPKNMIITSLGLLVVAGSLVLLADALEKMGSMSWDEIGKGLATLAGSLLILAGGLYAMQGSIGGSIALLIAAGALSVFVPVLRQLGSMSLTEIVTGLGALAGVFVILGLAGYLLTPVVPTLLSLAGAILLLGVGIAAIGAGVLLFSTGMAALAVSGTAGALALVSIIATILGIVPLIVETLGNALAQLLQIIIELAPLIGETLKVIILTLIDVIVEITPPLLDGLRTLLLKFIDVIVEVTPALIDGILILIGDLLTSLAESVPDFVQSGFDILLGILQGIADNIGEVVTTTVEIVTAFLTAIADSLPDIIQAGFDVVIAFIEGLATSIEENRDELGEAVSHLGEAIADGFKDGITAGVGGVVSAIRGLGGAAVSALKSLLGIFSPSRVFFDLGSTLPEGAANGITKFTTLVVDAVKNMGTKATTGMNDAISKISDTVQNHIDAEPTIRPVLDLSEIVDGSNAVNDILGKSGFELPVSISKISKVSSGMDTDVLPDGKGPDDGLEKQVIFNQNNYSPKALSRIEIYRQTKNQLRTAKGLV